MKNIVYIMFQLLFTTIMFACHDENDKQLSNSLKAKKNKQIISDLQYKWSLLHDLEFLRKIASGRYSKITVSKQNEYASFYVRNAPIEKVKKMMEKAKNDVEQAGKKMIISKNGDNP